MCAGGGAAGPILRPAPAQIAPGALRLSCASGRRLRRGCSGALHRLHLRGPLHLYPHLGCSLRIERLTSSRSARVGARAVARGNRPARRRLRTTSEVACASHDREPNQNVHEDHHLGDIRASASRRTFFFIYCFIFHHSHHAQSGRVLREGCGAGLRQEGEQRERLLEHAGRDGEARLRGLGVLDVFVEHPRLRVKQHKSNESEREK